MSSKALAFVLLALASLTAAAGGAYLAVRHNDSDAAAVRARSVSAPAAPTAPSETPSSQPVAETEAAVSAPKPESKPLAEAAPANLPAPAQPARRESKPAAKAAPVAQAEAPAARPPQRTVPAIGGGTAAPQTDNTSPPQATNSAPPVPAATRAPDAPRPAEDPQPEPVRAPQFEDVILPASAVIGLQVETATSTERARVEDRVDARVSRDVMAGGRVAIPAGSRMIGSVTTVERGGKVKEQARLGIRFHTLVLADGTQMPLQTEPVMRLGEAPSASSSKKIGGAAVGGAILGAILGGGKGAAAGGAIGAGAGTAAVMAGDRSAATLRQGEYLNVKLSAPLTITVPRTDIQ